MSEADQIARLLSYQIDAEVMIGPRHGFIVCDQVKRPVCVLGGIHFPDTITQLWQEGSEWVWEFHWVVPGPGPKRRYPSLEAVVDDIIREVQICRDALSTSTQS